MKRLALLGSTGSIGRQTLEVVRAHPDKLRVVGLAGHGNADLLARQIREFRPSLVSCEAPLPEGLQQEAGFMFCSLEAVAAHAEADLVVLATVGRAGLAPALAAVQRGRSVALANKEVLVMAGEIIAAEARRHGARLLPIDSEHSALWQCLQGETGHREIARIILTASGGALRDLSLAQLAGVSAAEALRHPTWLMGKKITIDSATLMNKGFEVMETHWLFDIPYEAIEVLTHRESIVHSLVEFVDGSVKAQLSQPDMRLPIQYALSHPERWESPAFPRLDLVALGRLTFEEPDLSRYPCLKLALAAAHRGGTYPAVLSAADEVAVSLFLESKISFLEIPQMVGQVLEQHVPRAIAHPTLEEIREADAWARAAALTAVLRGVR